VERGATDYAICSLKLSSVPPKAEVYLIPAYIWDQGDQNRPPPSQLKGSELLAYLKDQDAFRVQEGPTNVETRVIEQTYVALFLLGAHMQRQRLNILPGETPLRSPSSINERHLQLGKFNYWHTSGHSLDP
jgi:hypothetical protein